LDPRTVNILSWLTIVGSLAATAALWVVGLSLRGLSLQDLL
jgi:hypothetical protein